MGSALDISNEVFEALPIMGANPKLKEVQMSKKGSYKSPYSPEEVGDGMTPTGFTSRELFRMEESAQRVVAESEQWLLACKLNDYQYAGDKNSRSRLEALGFQVIRQVDDLFYEVISPAGWTRETEGFWTTVKDEHGNERIMQFYKGAFYDRDAFLNFKS